MTDRYEDTTDRYDIREIGRLDMGIDGTDQYLLVRDLQQYIDKAHVYDTIMPRFYRDCTRPGGYFCTDLRIIPDPVLKHECIVIVQHRYDV